MVAITFPPIPSIVRSAEGIQKPMVPSPVVACGAATLGTRVGKPPLPSPAPRFLESGAQLPTHFHPSSMGLKVFEGLMNGKGTIQRADTDALCFSVAFPSNTNVSFSLTVDARGVVWMENDMPRGAGDFFDHTTHHIQTAVQALPGDDPLERAFLVPAYEEVDPKDQQAKRKTIAASRLTVRYAPEAIAVTFRGNTVTLRLPAAK